MISNIEMKQENSLAARFVQLSNNVTLEYVEAGYADGIPAVFLHGLTDSWHSFEKILPLLPQNVHAFAISQRGHGDSQRPATGYEAKDFAQDVALFLEKQNIKQAVIVGHSMGGVVAQQFAIDYPHRTTALVIVDSDASFANNDGLDAFSHEVMQLKDPIDRRFMTGFQLSSLAKPMDEEYMETLIDESMKVPARVFQAAIKGLMNVDLTSELKNIQAPALILWGDQDGFCLRTGQEALQQNIRNATLLVYEKTGHALHWEEPGRFVRDLAAFIGSLAIQYQKQAD